MNDTPPTDDQDDDLEELYRKSSAHYPSRPSAKARRAILEHAGQLAANRSQAPGTGRIPRVARPSTENWRRPVFVGSLAAAALAGLLVGPQFLRPSAPPGTLPAVPTAATSTMKVPKPAAPSVSAAAEPSEPPPAAANLPVTGRARNIQMPAMQLAPRLSANVPANSDRAPSGPGEPTALAGASAAAQQDSARVTVTGMRVRPAPFAPGGDSAASEARLSAAASIDARDAQGRTALMLAVLQGRLDSVVSLLRRGADPNAADLAGMTPLQAAVANQKPEIADALRGAGAR